MRRALALVCLALTCSWPSAALGQDEKPAEADARFEEGVTLQKAGKWAEARMKYLQALSLFRSHSTLMNLAVVEVELGKYDEALLHVRGYIAHPQANPVKVAAVKKEMLPDLMSRTGHLEVKAPGGAVVKVDGKEWGKAPLEVIDVMPGKHVVSAGERTSEVNVKGGESRVVDLMPAAAPAPTPAPSASASAPTPFAPPPPPPPEGSSTKWIVAGGLAAGAVAGVAVGAGFGVASGNTAREIDDAKAQSRGACADRQASACQAVQSRIDDLDRQRLWSFVGYAAGGALGAGAVLTVIFWPSPKRGASGISFQPMDGGGGLVRWDGRF